MTPEELNEVKLRVNAATPGPWHADITDASDIVVWGPEKNQFIGNVGRDRYSETHTAVYFDGEAEDAIFIAAARSDVVALVAEVRRLQKELRIAYEVPEERDM